MDACPERGERPDLSVGWGMQLFDRVLLPEDDQVGIGAPRVSVGRLADPLDPGDARGAIVRVHITQQRCGDAVQLFCEISRWHFSISLSPFDVQADVTI